METFRIEVGHVHGVKPGNIVGAIANEAELESRYIGRIDIRDDHSLIDLPEGMPREVMEHLKKVRVAGQQLRISRPGQGGWRQSQHQGHDEGRPARAHDDRPRGAHGDDQRPRGPRPQGPRPHDGRPGGRPHGTGPRKPFKPR